MRIMTYIHTNNNMGILLTSSEQNREKTVTENRENNKLDQNVPIEKKSTTLILVVFKANNPIIF